MIVPVFLAVNVNACSMMQAFLQEWIAQRQQRGALQLAEEEEQEQAQETNQDTELLEAGQSIA